MGCAVATLGVALFQWARYREARALALQQQQAALAGGDDAIGGSVALTVLGKPGQGKGGSSSSGGYASVPIDDDDHETGGSTLRPLPASLSAISFGADGGAGEGRLLLLDAAATASELHAAASADFAGDPDADHLAYSESDDGMLGQ